MPRPTFTEMLARRPLLADGATGTQLQQMGLAPGQAGERWNLDAPEHIATLRAGEAGR